MGALSHVEHRVIQLLNMNGRLLDLVRTGYRFGERNIRNKLGLHDSEEVLSADAQKFWDGVSSSDRDAGKAHWRGNGVFANDDERWYAVGRNNLHKFNRLAGEDWLRQRHASVVEWGCGGGANAVQFAPGAARYYGVDITAASLIECQRQMEGLELHNFVPVQFDLAEPEQVGRLIPEPCALFLSTYVFELIPSKAYGKRILQVAYQLLAPGGLAFIQVKYADCEPQSHGYRYNYERHMANMTTYRVEEFWAHAEESGLRPDVLLLEPEQPLVHDRRYAYFLLQKP